MIVWIFWAYRWRFGYLKIVDIGNFSSNCVLVGVAAIFLVELGGFFDITYHLEPIIVFGVISLSMGSILLDVLINFL